MKIEIRLGVIGDMNTPLDVNTPLFFNNHFRRMTAFHGILDKKDLFYDYCFTIIIYQAIRIFVANCICFFTWEREQNDDL